jgi:4-amino-4-deoxy-L-arabinose transferase-like glycosyltransferase
MKSSWLMKCFLMVITVCALFLRTYVIAKDPPSLSWDEVSIGYNAYSILKTGRDEHGQFMPIAAFAAYGDYKPPFAIYVTVPFVALLGLNELAVRLPSALFGTATVLLTYFLVKELFTSQKKNKFSGALPILSAFVLAISPWHVNLSRAGFEANIALFFVVLGAWILLTTRDHSKRFYVAWIPFVIAIYTFNSARYFVVFLGIAVLICIFSTIKKHRKQFTIGVIIAAVSVLPIIPHLLSKESRIRYDEVNIFTDSSVVVTANKRIAREGNSFISKLVNNRRVGYARSFLIHFFDNLQPDFLFIKGDGNPKFSIQDVGQLYLIEAPFLVIGIFTMLSEYPSIALFLLYWLVTAIIPAATARETPHALRILNSLPTWQIFIAFGILSAYQFAGNAGKKINIKSIYGIVVIIFYIFSVIYYLHNYYFHFPKEFSGEWQYGYREALLSISKIQSRYDSIVMTESIGRPYMYTLFYTKTDPNVLFRTKKAWFDAAGFYHVDAFGKYRFGSTLPDSLEPGTLYIWHANAVPVGARIIDTVKLLNGNPVLAIFDNGGVSL